MADFPDQRGGVPVGRAVGTMATFAGAAVSFMLLGGVGIWGYQLVVRDVSGVPVVRALEGPMRVAPKDPGGDLAAHQGLSVNEVAGLGTAQPAPDTLLLAPDQPGIEDNDVAGVALAPVAPEPEPEPVIAEADDAIQPLAMDTETGTDTAEAPAAGGLNATILALADQIASGVDPLTESGPADTPPVTTELAEALPGVEAEDEIADAPAPLAALPVPEGALARSLRPQLRPQGLRTARAEPLAAPESAPAVAASEIDPASLPAGTRLVQLGAFDSPEVARSEWERLSAKFDTYLAGKSRVIERAKSGGRTFFRLRAMGFADLDEARRFCSALNSGRADCIPVVTR